MIATVVTPLRALLVVVAVAAALTALAANREPSAADGFVEHAAGFTASYDLMQRDLSGASSSTEGLAVLDAGVASLDAELIELRQLQTSMTGDAAQPSVDLVASAQQLVDALRAYGDALRSGDLHTAKRRLDDESRARSSYDEAAAELS